MKFKKFLDDNAGTILATTAVLSTISTVGLSYRLGKQLEQMRAERAGEGLDTDPKTMFKLVWRKCIPLALSFTTTVTGVILLHRVGNNKAATLVASALANHRVLEAYVSKLEKKLGDEKIQEVRDEIAQENVQANPPKEIVLIEGEGDVLVRDGFSGRYFKSTRNKIEAAVNVVNNVINNVGYASLTDYYDEIGLEPTDVSDHIGWNRDELMSVHFGAAMTLEDRPCLEACFRAVPFVGYDQLF